MKRVLHVSVAVSCVFVLAVAQGFAQRRRHRSISDFSLFPCQYKTVRVPGENGESQKLSRPYDRKRIAAAMKLNRTYEVFERYDGDGVIVSRTFHGVKYNLVFDPYGGFNLHTYNFKGYPGRGTVSWGEKCGTPDRVLRRNVYRMIEDLPLEVGQKAELKGYVLVTKAMNGRIF